MGEEQAQKVLQHMRPRDRKPEFFQKSFQVLLGALLAMKADDVMQRVASAVEPCGGAVIGLGLVNPLPGQPFHRGLSPWM